MTMLILGIVSFIVIVTLAICVVILSCSRADLKEQLNNQLCDYRVLKTKYDYMCHYCINDAELAPDGTYFIFIHLDIMQHILTGKWYHIPDKIDVNCGYDIDGDILYLYRNTTEGKE